MALHWDLSGIKDYKSVCWCDVPEKEKADGDEVQLTSVTNVLIWLTMIVGLNRITEKNAAMFYARIRVWEMLYGAMQNSGDLISPTNVRDHIGLKTNACDYSDAAFRKRALSEAMRIGKDRYTGKDR